jgi:pSer/pThr/pTyr-binding forkhead associated (FHA) protein
MKDTDSTALRDREADATEWRLARIQKRPGFPPYNRIVVVRAPVCDLVVPFHSVSRFHAQFHVESHRVVALEDKGSRNGTLHNGRRLEPHEVVRIKHADELRFGDVSCEVLDGAGLYGLLRAM